MAVETESFTAGDGTDITSVSSGVWSYANGTTGDLYVTSNQIRHVVNRINLSLARRSGTFTDDQYAKITLKKVSVVAGWIGVAARVSNGNGYWLHAHSGGYGLGKLVSYGYTGLRFGSMSWTPGDILALEVEGTTLRCLKNGAMFWTQTDSSLASGAPGISASGENTTDFNAADDWEGGDLAVAAPQSWQYDWPHQLHVRR